MHQIRYSYPVSDATEPTLHVSSEHVPRREGRRTKYFALEQLTDDGHLIDCDLPDKKRLKRASGIKESDRAAVA